MHNLIYYHVEQYKGNQITRKAFEDCFLIEQVIGIPEINGRFQEHSMAAQQRNGFKYLGFEIKMIPGFTISTEQ